jgi:GrpB-like predicted nucleotidyltransferase (UPF0157 family)
MKYVFKPYLKAFPELFQKEKARISMACKAPLQIEHVGSTAVPGLGGKGIIDIAIGVKPEKFDEIIDKLQNLGYEYRPRFSTPSRAYLVIELPDPVEDKRRYHVHLTDPDGAEWKEFIGFRDFLRSNPEESQKYAEIKKRATLQANQDGPTYRRLKEQMYQQYRRSRAC